MSHAGAKVRMGSRDLVGDRIAAMLQLVTDSAEHASPITWQCSIDVRGLIAPGGMPLFLPTAMVRSLWRGSGGERSRELKTH